MINQDLKVKWLTVCGEKVLGFIDQIHPHLLTTLHSPLGLPCAGSPLLENPNLNLIPNIAEPGWCCWWDDSVRSQYIPLIINHLNLTPINYSPWISFLSVFTSHNKWGHSVSVRHWSRHHWESHRALWCSDVAGGDGMGPIFLLLSKQRPWDTWQRSKRIFIRMQGNDVSLGSISILVT